jgi:glycine/D-amino acid oxidase-like deaminating enzyme
MSSYVAKRTPVHRGPAAWSAILPGQDAPIVLESNATADVAIVGCGFAGMSAARRLKQLDPTTKVVVLEAGRIAEGACGRNAGFMIDLPHEIGGQGYGGDGAAKNRAMIALNRQAIGFARAAVEDYEIDRNFFDPVGKVNGAASAKADTLNRQYATQLAEVGEGSAYLDAKAMHELTGSRHYVSGLFTPGTVMIQPAGYVRGVVRGLRHNNAVQIYENSPVQKIERNGTGWTLSSNGHAVSVGKVILANNGHLESFGFAKQRLMHIFLYASMTVDLPPEYLKKLGGQPRWGVTPSDPMGTTMRRINGPLGGNRIITRTCFSFLPGMVPSEATLKRTAKVHRQKFAERFHEIKDAPMEHTWAGHLCLTRNGVAVMRELEPGLYSACVQNGLGTVRGTLTGIGAAELACGVESDITRHFTVEPEPSLLPPPPISTIGANAYLRYKEWAARPE